MENLNASDLNTFSDNPRFGLPALDRLSRHQQRWMNAQLDDPSGERRTQFREFLEGFKEHPDMLPLASWEEAWKRKQKEADAERAINHALRGQLIDVMRERDFAQSTSFDLFKKLHKTWDYKIRRFFGWTRNNS